MATLEETVDSDHKTVEAKGLLLQMKSFIFVHHL